MNPHYKIEAYRTEGKIEVCSIVLYEKLTKGNRVPTRSTTIKAEDLHKILKGVF